MKTDGLQATALMKQVSQLYKEAGEEKKARYIFEKQRTLKIQLLHETREEILKIAQTAEQDGTADGRGMGADEIPCRTWHPDSLGNTRGPERSPRTRRTGTEGPPRAN